MNYWMAESLGLSELTQPLFDHLLHMLPKGEDVASRMYGTNGFCCHHNTDIWGDCAPQDAHATSTIWPMGAAWLALHVVDHWRYTHDEKFLATYFCIVEEAARFLAGYLVEDPDGYLVTGPSVSPENTYLTPEGEIGSLCMGPAMDTEIVQELFCGYLELARQAAADSDLVETVNSALPCLRPLEIGRHGQIVEWSHDFEETEPGHRHISQLFALYPGTAIRPEKTPDLASAAERTLERRLSHGGGHTGWSKAWIALLFARLHRGEDAWGNFCGLLSNSTQENLLDSHPPFQIDGNFGGCAALAEMLVQDFGDEILLLPALPEALLSGSLEGVFLKNG
jgi:alpha-L-fucosidase 2